VSRVVFHSGAEADLRAAVAHYEKERAGLGRELRQAVEAAVWRITQTPQMFPIHGESGTRKCPVRRFPFTIYFAELRDSTWIVAVAHHRRRPDYWRGRRPE
jgi:toxin ParE1/3/4